MAKLKPWYLLLDPREDLRENRPLDASEFAVHLDHVRDGRAHDFYKKPELFFSRTYLTSSLLALCAEVARRLSGIQVETSAVFNMVTQFGGGKTHALTALYHLGTVGPESRRWKGVESILRHAKVDQIPKAKVGVFVGSELDVLTGRTGPGEPTRRTPWGELAWQLGGAKAYQAVAGHDEKRVSPAGQALRAMLPDGPTIILMDELVNFASRWRKEGMREELYNFLQNLSEEARARSDLVLCVSIPKSTELEMNPEDQRDYDAFKKLLDRLGKAVTMSADAEASEIVRRRLFEWEVMPDEAKKVITAYADWVQQHKGELAGLDAATAADAFRASYPFHPTVLSVFERKWQSLHRFQRTRGVLRLLAQWVARTYHEKSGAPLITLGSAPLEDPWFRTAVFEQLGEERLAVPVETDIVGRKNSHAVLLDREASDAIKKARLHQKVATAIFFESNGGQSQARAEATKPEIKAALGSPDLNLADIDQALEGLEASTFYLGWERERYRFSLTPNLNQVLVSRRAGITPKAIDERLRKDTEKLFKEGSKAFQRCFFPQVTNDIPDRPRLTLVVLGTDSPNGEPATMARIEELVRDCGHSGRTFKTALVFAVSAGSAGLRDSVRNALAWEDVDDDDETKKRLDDSQRKQLQLQVKRAQADLKEALFRAYRFLVLLGKDNKLQEIDLGQLTSSAGLLVDLMKNALVERDEVTESVGAAKVEKSWPAMTEWSTKAVRDAFFASPALPRLLDPDSIKQTIARGVSEKRFGLARRSPSGELVLERFEKSMVEGEVELSEDVFLLRAADAQKLLEPPRLVRITVQPGRTRLRIGETATFTVAGVDQYGQPMGTSAATWTCSGGTIDQRGVFTAGAPGLQSVEANTDGCAGLAEVEVSPVGGGGDDDGGSGGGDGSGGADKARTVRWRGVVPRQKYAQLFTNVLSRFKDSPDLKITVQFELTAEDASAQRLADDARSALKELGLDAPDLLQQ